MVRVTPWVGAIVVVLASCGPRAPDSATDHKAHAEAFFRGIYGCDATVVDRYASDQILISYPIFATLFDTPAIRGREAVREFATGFCSRWSDARMTFHEALEDSNRVVLVWEFQAVRRSAPGETPASPPAARSWGGMSLFRFDDAGRIVAEVGEESDPGPWARLAIPGAS